MPYIKAIIIALFWILICLPICSILLIIEKISSLLSDLFDTISSLMYKLIILINEIVSPMIDKYHAQAKANKDNIKP